MNSYFQKYKLVPFATLSGLVRHRKNTLCNGIAMQKKSIIKPMKPMFRKLYEYQQCDNNSSGRKEIAGLIIVALLVLLFSYTAISKLLDYKKFVFQMSLVPVEIIKELSPLLGWLIPAIELAIVLFLLVSKLRPLGLSFSIALLSVFTGYISLLLLTTGNQLPCTCAGVISKMSWQIHLLFNIFFLVLAVIAYILYKFKTTKKNI